MNIPAEPSDSPVPDGRHADLLPTGNLSPDRFEDFTEDLLNAHRFVAEPARHVLRVQRWGRRGDKQHGIDFEGTWSDGTAVAWQCKRLDKLSEADVHAFVAECTFVADEYYIVYSGEASSAARRAVKAHEGWDILDRRGLTQMLEDVPLHRQRRLLDAMWGETFRRHFLRVPGDDSFLGLQDMTDRRRSADDLLNDLGPTAGRVKETEALASALDRTQDWPRVVIVSGVGGIGKTRLMVQCLNTFQESNPQIQVLWLSPGQSPDVAAVRELPLTPAVVVVDDAHRIGDLGPLLNYAKQYPDTQLVLGARGLESRSILFGLLRGGFNQDEIRHISVEPLRERESRSLVTALSDGLSIDYPLTELLVRQACDAPFMAVLTLNMIRRGLLSGHLAVNAGLRQQVMARYEDVLVEGVDAVERRRVQKVLATLSALGAVDLNDKEIRTGIMEMGGIELEDYLELLAQLRDRGVLLEQGGRARVGPELFADQVLEQASVIGGNPTSFIATLWDALGEVAREDLLTSIGSLEWRLSQLKGPSVMNPVWAGLEAVIDRGGYGTLYALAGHLGMLPLTQPAKTVWILGRIQHRLDVLDALPPDENPSGRSLDDDRAAMFGSGLIDRTAVERRLAAPYGACAANEPEVLEEVLDALWSLGRGDPRAIDKALDHPCRVILDQLCNLARLPDRSYPLRIIAAVARWLAEPPRPDDALTPLFAVAPFLAKEGTTTDMGHNALSLKSYLIDPASARPLRDAIRELCLGAASDENLPLTAEILKLLEGAVSEPIGLVGAQVDDEHRTVWSEDDLATIATLRTIAESTHKSVVRRAVRRAAEIPAAHATSPEMRHAALSLLTWLDQLEDDDLSDYLLGGETLAGPASQRGQTVPPLEELRKAISAASSTDPDAKTDDFDSRWQEHLLRVQASLTRLADSIWPPSNSPKAGVQRVDRELREALLMSEASPTMPPNQIVELFSHLVAHRPAHLVGIVEEIIELPDGPIDLGVPVLLEGLRSGDEVFLESLFIEMQNQREGMRRAVARAARIYGWAERGGPYAEVVMRGTTDRSEGVRQEFLAALPLMSDPVSVSGSLIEHGADEGTISGILGAAAGLHGLNWGRELTSEQASAVLDLLSRLKVGTWQTETLIADIASNHARLVLDRLSNDRALGQLLRLPMYGILQQTLAENPGAIAGWILAECKGPNQAGVAEVLSKVVGERLPHHVKDALIAAAGDLDEEQLSHLFGILSPIDAWAAHHIDLARRLIHRARQLGPETLGNALDQIRRRLTPTFWTYHGPESPELRAALASLAAASKSETDADLHELELGAERSLIDRIAQIMQEFEEENS
ncbi:P-loop NTPase [Sinomonas cyclohexanicum]|uniref:P-loop NTPase n=1 Tax=Sinomonas cyclohexanicum TaxID=322009 RepID=UPI001E37CD2F|nr:restriction endonuclease [Corynebacterium cyclohexanicum]